METGDTPIMAEHIQEIWGEDNQSIPYYSEHRTQLGSYTSHHIEPERLSVGGERIAFVQYTISNSHLRDAFDMMIERSTAPRPGLSTPNGGEHLRSPPRTPLMHWTCHSKREGRTGHTPNVRKMEHNLTVRLEPGAQPLCVHPLHRMATFRKCSTPDAGAEPCSPSQLLPDGGADHSSPQVCCNGPNTPRGAYTPQPNLPSHGSLEADAHDPPTLLEVQDFLKATIAARNPPPPLHSRTLICVSGTRAR